MNMEIGGVVAAIITPIGSDGEPDIDRLIVHALRLFEQGCDGINLLGTTGEATSLSVQQRKAVMEAVASSDLPLDNIMVGTGAAAGRDAVDLTQAAAQLGFAGALLLPPFYYKPVTNEGVANFITLVVEATAAAPIPILLYNFPALSGICYTPELVALLLDRFPERIAGLKDSSGDLSYAQEIANLSPNMKVFPSNEATLLRARAGEFAGCISATANLNAHHCAAAYRNGDAQALDRAIAIRAIFDGIPLVPGIKAILAIAERDEALAELLPPLVGLSASEQSLLQARYEALAPL